MSSYAAFRDVSAYAGYVISINEREPYAQPWNAPLIETTKTDATSVTDVDMRTLPTWDPLDSRPKDRKAFSYNKRTMDRAMEPF